MAMLPSTDVRKSSYYVLFLGAKEARGPPTEALLQLIARERQVEPVKVTLTVSCKGVKIVEPLPGSKHFVPPTAIVEVSQGPPPNDDVVICVVVIWDPSPSPAVPYVHAYRCDSVDTATVLRRHLQSIRQRRPAESESSGSSEATAGEVDDRTAHLYASLAAELRQKLRGGSPLLLPPRDYDTVHRRRGQLQGIELRKSMQVNVVGPHGVFTRPLRPEPVRIDSGIGSDDAPAEATSSEEDDWSPNELTSNLVYRVPRIRTRSYHELPEDRRYPGLDRATARTSTSMDNSTFHY